MSDLRLLRHFIAVYRHHSFGSAASELGVAQSSVTKRIQQLESQLGMRLFNRTTRAVEPTDSARQLITYAESAVQAAGVFQEEARLLAGGEIGGIRVGAIALAAETLIVGGLAHLARSHPNLEVDVVVGSSDIYKDLASGACDMALGDESNFASSAYAASLRMQRVHREQLVYVHRANHPAANASALPELLNYPLAIPSRYFNDNKPFEALAAQAGEPVAPRYRLNSLSACMSLAATSDVVTLAPESLVLRPAPVATEENASALRIANFSTGIELSMVLVTVAKNAPTPAMRAFATAISRA